MVIDAFNMLMYAEYTTLYCNTNQIVYKVAINHELLKVSQWLAANKLSLNVGKTKFMVFHNRNKAVSYPEHLNGNKLERVAQCNCWVYDFACKPVLGQTYYMCTYFSESVKSNRYNICIHVD